MSVGFGTKKLGAQFTLRRGDRKLLNSCAMFNDEFKFYADNDQVHRRLFEMRALMVVLRINVP
jgi:hypothetical protein